ncbi:ABC transporter permease [Amycolatopsis anabasis]|uniref:ABC transporter permease n=1 Tax=Amycolatopsis anabasis TaxID=1840409 RepID=UPI00131B8CF6|nr:FtsX-like permease family protein [Amycolatopsis anabasis]
MTGRRVPASLTRFRLFNLRPLGARKGRSVLALGVVAVSAALVVAVFGTYGSLTGSVERLADGVAGAADLEVTGVAESGLPAELLPEIAARPEVAAAVPIIQSAVRIGPQRAVLFGADDRLRELGSDLQRAIDSVPRRDLPPDGVVLGSGLAGAAGLAPGQRIRLTSYTGTSHEVTVALVARGELASRVNSGFFVLAPLPLAQQLAGRDDRLDSVLVVARDGVDVESLRRNLDVAVDDRAFVGTPRFRAAQAGTAVSLAMNSTLVVAFMALAVAGFLVFNTMNRAAVERRPAIATLRALGGRRATVLRGLLAESVLLGILGALVGGPLGVLLARWAIHRLPPFLAETFDARVEFALPWYAIPLALGACVATSVIGSWLASVRAFRVAPVEAMRPAELADGDEERQRYRMVAAIAGVAFLAIAAVLVTVSADEWALSAVAWFVVGVIVLGYALLTPITKVVARVAGRLGGTGRLAAAAMRRAPRRIWATTMVVAIAVGIGVATTGASQNLVTSARDALGPLGRIDLSLHPTPPDMLPTGPALPPSLHDRLAGVDGVDRVVPSLFGYATVDGSRVVLQGASAGSNLVPVAKASERGRAELLSGTGAVLSGKLARERDLRVGDSFTLPSPEGPQRLRVADIVDYPTVDTGLVAISLDRARQWFHREGATMYEVQLRPGAELDAVRTTIQRMLSELPYPMYVVTGSDLLEATSTAVRQAASLALAIQWIVAGVAALALLNTLMLSVLERQRELGILRALGANRRTIRRVVVTEAAAVGAIGGAVGLGVGLALHYLITFTLAATTGIEVAFEVIPISLGLGVAVVLLSLLGSLPPARRAARLNVLKAIGWE